MGKTEFVGMRIEPEMLEKIDDLAKKEKRSRSNMIEILLEEALSARNKKR